MSNSPAPKKWSDHTPEEQKQLKVGFVAIGAIVLLLVILFSSCSASSTRDAVPAPQNTHSAAPEAPSQAPVAPEPSVVPEETPEASYGPGNPEVYKRIEAETDCSALQQQFDLAVKNGELARDNGKIELAQINTAYMKAALNRQNELKCFG